MTGVAGVVNPFVAAAGEIATSLAGSLLTKTGGSKSKVKIQN